MVPLLVFHMTKPHGSHLITLGTAWLPLSSSPRICRAQQGRRPRHTTHPLPPSFPHTHAKEGAHWRPGQVQGWPGISRPHSMERSFQLLACLVCIVLMGEFATLLSGPCLEQNRCSQTLRYSLLASRAARLPESLGLWRRKGCALGLWRQKPEVQVQALPWVPGDLTQCPDISGPQCVHLQKGHLPYSAVRIQQDNGPVLRKTMKALTDCRCCFAS